MDAGIGINFGLGRLIGETIEVSSKGTVKSVRMNIYVGSKIEIRSNNITMQRTYGSPIENEKTKIMRIIAYNYLEINDLSSLSAHTIVLKGDQGLTIKDSFVKSLTLNTCNMGNPFETSLFFCI